jgi:nucleoside recognition membrane protein YjiH
MTKELYDSGTITDKERTIFCQLQFSGNGTVTNYFSSVAGGLMVYFAATNVPIIVPFIIILICKIIGANLMRLVLIRKES